MTGVAFNLVYEQQDVPCRDAGCAGCRAVHRRATGSARLTLVGPAAEIRRIAASIYPLLLPSVDAAASTLTAHELDAMPTGAKVMAGHFYDDQRTERVEWFKTLGRWQLSRGNTVEIAGSYGVSSIWLAANRKPTLLVDEEQESAFLNMTCVACGASTADGIPVDPVARKCPECVAGGYEPIVGSS